MNLNPYFTAYIKINSKYITYLNIRSEIIKPLEENMGGGIPCILTGYKGMMTIPSS